MFYVFGSLIKNWLNGELNVDLFGAELSRGAAVVGIR
jgi:hypothetical protein